MHVIPLRGCGNLVMSVSVDKCWKVVSWVIAAMTLGYGLFVHAAERGCGERGALRMGNLVLETKIGSDHWGYWLVILRKTLHI